MEKKIFIGCTEGQVFLRTLGSVADEMTQHLYLKYV